MLMIFPPAAEMIPEMSRVDKKIRFDVGSLAIDSEADGGNGPDSPASRPVE